MKDRTSRQRSRIDEGNSIYASREKSFPFTAYTNATILVRQEHTDLVVVRLVRDQSSPLLRHRCTEQQHQDHRDDVVDGPVLPKERPHRDAPLHPQETGDGVSGLRNGQCRDATASIRLEFPCPMVPFEFRRDLVCSVSEIMLHVSTRLFVSHRRGPFPRVETTDLFFHSLSFVCSFVRNSRE